MRLQPRLSAPRRGRGPVSPRVRRPSSHTAHSRSADSDSRPLRRRHAWPAGAVSPRGKPPSPAGGLTGAASAGVIRATNHSSVGQPGCAGRWWRNRAAADRDASEAGLLLPRVTRLKVAAAQACRRHVCAPVSVRRRVARSHAQSGPGPATCVRDAGLRATSSGVIRLSGSIGAEGVPISEIRERTGLSQSQFSALLGVSVRTFQEWEQGRRAPSGAARTLLMVAARNPRALVEVA